MFANLPDSFPNFLAVSPPISVFPPLSSSSSLSPNRRHPPLFETALLLMALFDNKKQNVCNNVHIFIIHQMKKLFLILSVALTVIGSDFLSQSLILLKLFKLPTSTNFPITDCNIPCFFLLLQKLH